MKRCHGCDEIKDVLSFHVDKSRADGRCDKCKGCVKDRDTKRRLNHKEKVDSEKRLWSKSDKGKATARAYLLFTRWGITQSDYDLMYQNQNGVCAICHKPESVLGKSLAVDHNHETGNIRALLCLKCNKGIGLFNDSAVLVEKALKYIRSYQ